MSDIANATAQSDHNGTGRLIEHAPAKINLTLKVLGRRPDRLHELQSLIAFARDAADTITLDLGKPPGVTLTGPFAATIAGENLVDVTLSKAKAADPGLRLGHVTLEKHLPVAAGVGGGSADAAALLRLIARANPEHAPRIDWYAIAASLGADVPVCLADRSAWVMGFGERLLPVERLPQLEAVLINPRQAMPADKTARVFKTLAAADFEMAHAPLPLPAPTDKESLLRLMREVGNDLSAPAEVVAPVVAAMMQALQQAPGCHYAAVSGGGPTCFGIFDDAASAADAVARSHPDWWVKATVLA